MSSKKAKKDKAIIVGTLVASAVPPMALGPAGAAISVLAIGAAGMVAASSPAESKEEDKDKEK
jgi:hypothetical protein